MRGKTISIYIPDGVLKDLRKLERSKVEGNNYLKELIEIYNRYRLGDLKHIERFAQRY